MTEFAVAPVNCWATLREIRKLGHAMSVKVGEQDRTRDVLARNWTRHVQVAPNRYILTDAGKLALELREALGPDRGLTRAGAKALLKGGATRATRLRLMQDGLWHRSYTLGVPDAWLTEDGLKIREILRKYRAEV